MVNAISPALYVGRLRHRRFTPTPHAFSYSLFMAMLDIDDIDAAMGVSRLTSHNRFNVASFDDRDHTGDSSLPLRERLRQSAASAGLTLPDGPIHLLTHLRYLGYSFNPISFYYCYDRGGRLQTICGEAHNTFGGERLYWLPLSEATSTGAGLHFRTPKQLHVSPFMPMDVDYEFVLTPPTESLVAHIATTRRRESGAAPFFDATLTLERRPWTASTVRRALARHPALTAKVIAAIHWEALRLWWKGLPVYDGPAAEAPESSHSREAEA